MTMYYRTGIDAKETSDLSPKAAGLVVCCDPSKIQQKFTLVLYESVYYRAPYSGALVTLFSCAVATGQRGLAGILILAARLGF